jgi:hypothetical protein
VRDWLYDHSATGVMYGANSSVSATDREGFMLFLCVVFKKERKIVKINYTPKPYKAVENNWCDWMHSRHVRYHGKVRYRNVVYNLDVPVDSQLLMLRLIVDGYVHKVSQDSYVMVHPDYLFINYDPMYNRPQTMSIRTVWLNLKGRLLEIVEEQGVSHVL